MLVGRKIDTRTAWGFAYLFMESRIAGPSCGRTDFWSSRILRQIGSAMPCFRCFKSRVANLVHSKRPLPAQGVPLPQILSAARSRSAFNQVHLIMTGTAH